MVLNTVHAGAERSAGQVVHLLAWWSDRRAGEPNTMETGTDFGARLSEFKSYLITHCWLSSLGL